MYFKEALLMIHLLIDCPIWPGKLHMQAGTEFVRCFGSLKKQNTFSFGFVNNVSLISQLYFHAKIAANV